MLKYSFRKYTPLSLRLWHWPTVLVIFGILGTVLLRKTFLSWHTNSVLIEEKLSASGIVITPELAKDIAISIRNPMWDWHIYLGFALGALFLGRILIALIVEKRCPGFQALKNILKIRNLPLQEKSEALHYTVVKIGYLVFYFLIALMVLTGLMLNFKAEIGLSKGLIGATKEIHELLMWFLIIFIGGHILGVVIAENRKDHGLVSDMIYGGDPDPHNNLPG
ncbi:MAG: cytochrome b/b6 domain-containing protein [Oligoflexia bacterium]|nr:cytochrome b/b6 domain-containing protein [Oligoflexia bacterium]